MQSIPFIDLKAQYDAYRVELDQAMTRVIESTCFIQGPEVVALEKELATYVGVRHCISCSSGTDALFIALRAIGIGPGDEVITTGFSFFATAGAISLTGAVPVFTDIDPNTCNIDPKLIEARITDRTKAILPVGLYGQPADMDTINQIAKKHGLIVIEDAAQSFGSLYKGRRSCSLSSIGCTSFYPAKPLGSFGEGGALFTDDDELAVRMRQIMNQGQKAGYDHAVVGINGRLQALQAAVLRVKLFHFDEELIARSKVAARYDQALAGIEGIVVPKIKPECTSVYAQYTIRTQNREGLRDYLTSLGIPTAVHYDKPIFRQSAYTDLGEDWLKENIVQCPVCENAAMEVLSLPFGPFLKESDQDRVIDGLNSFKRREL